MLSMFKSHAMHLNAALQDARDRFKYLNYFYLVLLSHKIKLLKIYIKSNLLIAWIKLLIDAILSLLAQITLRKLIMMFHVLFLN